VPLARVPQDKRDELRAQLQADVKAFYQQIDPLLRKKAIEVAPATLGSALEERFSEEELKQLIAWLESPVAKKFQQVQPELQASMVQKILTETGPAVDPKLRALQETMRKRFAALAPAAPASGPAASAPAKK
jgi:hypothetical protein